LSFYGSGKVPSLRWISMGTECFCVCALIGSSGFHLQAVESEQTQGGVGGGGQKVTRCSVCSVPVCLFISQGCEFMCKCEPVCTCDFYFSISPLSALTVKNKRCIRGR